MMSQTRQQIITIHILPNISRIKSNKEMKFVQLHKMRNIFLQNSQSKRGRETSSRTPFFFFFFFFF